MKVKHKIALRYIKTKLNLFTFLNRKYAGKVAFRLFCTPMTRANIPENEVFRKAERLSFSISGKKVLGYRCNHPAPFKILLLHGFSSTCQHFAHFVPPLVKKGHEVLAFDAPAHGFSEGSSINAVEYSQMIKKINELYGPISGYIAHSFGGISVMLALEEMEYPQETKVVLLAPATETTTAIDSAFQMLRIKNISLRKSIDEVILEKSGRPSSWYSLRRAIKNIKASVLWIHDIDDDITPYSDALNVKNDSPENVQFITTSRLGHRRIYKDPGVLKQVINFF